MGAIHDFEAVSRCYPRTADGLWIDDVDESSAPERRRSGDQKIAFVHCTSTKMTMTIPTRMPMMNLPTGAGCRIGFFAAILHHPPQLQLRYVLGAAITHHSPR
jgi:hypothetical protein